VPREPLACEAALKTTALAATFLFANGETTERTVTAAERLGRALGVTAKVLPYWGEITVELDGAPISQIVPAKPLGVDMGRVLVIMTVINQVCRGTLSTEAARSALESAGRLPPASTSRFTLFAAVGAASLGVIFGALDATSLLLIAASATIGALVRRWLAGFSHNPLIQSRSAPRLSRVSWLPLPAVYSYRKQQRWSLSVPAWCWSPVRISSTAPSTSVVRALRLESRA
jgi:uncharacterized membrane protein YjjP (DUF1212 family)